MRRSRLWPGPRATTSACRSRRRVFSEDVALLLAYEKGAQLIVAVGTHLNLIEFLERDRAGMSSTFVTRLKVGEILVDAKGVSRLVSRRVGMWPFVLLAAAGLLAVSLAIEGPWLRVNRSLPRRALNRLYALCQTAADL